MNRCPHCGKRPTRTLHLSARADGRGHWPLGKRRHRLSLVDLTVLRQALDLVDQRLARRELAAYLGVADSTISRWRSGRYLPDRDRLERILEFLGLPAPPVES